VIYKFQKSKYTLNQGADLIIKEENSLSVFKKNETKRIKLDGKYSKALGNYIVVKQGKRKAVYTYSGDLILSRASTVKLLDDDFITYKRGRSIYLLNAVTNEKKKVKKMNADLSEEEIEEEDEDEAVFVEPALVKETDTLFIKKRNGLYGLKSKTRIELPYSYFHIQRISDCYLIQNDLEYTIFNNYTKNFVTATPFKNCVKYKDYYMLVRDEGIEYVSFWNKR
jgi:sporulation protein YlmC with PRC-barrel domain